MRRVYYLVQKEFRQILRDHFMMRLILIVPILQVLVLGHALNTDLKNVDLAFIDHENSRTSRELIASFYASDLFRPADETVSPSSIESVLEKGAADMVVWIPRGYSDAITSRKTIEIGIYVDGTNSSLAGLAGAYANAIVRQQNTAIMDERLAASPTLRPLIHEVIPVVRFLYNPELNTTHYMVPGVVVLIVTIISGLLTGLAVVREKEIGTLEQLMVTPITSLELIAGKTLPYALLSFVDITVATLFAILYFKLPFAGSVILLGLSAMIYLLVTLGIGLLASTVSQTQQQAMFTVWFFLIFGILTSGFFYPLENMPEWIQTLTIVNPLRYFLAIVRGLFLKDLQFVDMLEDLIPLTILGVTVFAAAVLRFQKRLK
jgi:ABC-2 type transport system permease protein